MALEGVSVVFDGTTALDGVSFEVGAGRFAALIGPNGAGKSTCLKVLLGLVRPTRGRATVFGRPPGEGRGSVGYVPQKVEVPRGLPIRVLDIVLMGRTGLLGLGRRPGAADRAAARAALDQVGLGDAAARRFQDLSGGQQQRVLIARALCGEPRLLLLDEPTAGLDSAARARFYALVCDLQRERGLSLLCATHDLDVVGDHADTIVLLDGSVRALGRPDDVLAGPELGQVYAFPLAHVHAPDGSPGP